MPQILIKTNNKPDFNLPSPYNQDVWDIKNWDLYNNSCNDYKNKWISRSNIMNNTMDFRLCENISIREECKYFLYHLLDNKKLSLAALSDYADKFKLFFIYTSQNTYNSVLQIDLIDYEQYIGKRQKIITENGSSIINNELLPVKKRNKLISFLITMKQLIFEYAELSKPLYERDFWRGSLIDANNVDIHNLDFTSIIQPIMKQSAKDFLKFKIATINTNSASAYLRNIRTFCHWLSEYYPAITSFKDITRDILEDYFMFLRIESDFSQQMINNNIFKLSVMFEYALIIGDKNFPKQQLFLSNDYCFKTTRRTKFFTTEEIAAIFSLTPYLPKIYSRILLILHHCGMRISEILMLPIDCLKYSNGKPYLSLYMYKTERTNNVPLDEYAFGIIQREIEYTNRKFPNAKYVFVNTKGNHIAYSAFIKTIKRVVIKHNILGRDGQLLDFKTHRFRATKLNTLINMGEDPLVAAEMLGQKGLGSLSYYATATKTSLSEHMQEYLKKESILINSIGKTDGLTIENYENAVVLCNGWCCRPSTLGVCEKANACLSCSQFKPSLKHLTSYQLQLSEMESSLAVARENNFTRMIEKCEKDKSDLENIISRLEAMLNEKKHQTDGRL